MSEEATGSWHYADGEKTVGPLDTNGIQTVLSKVSNPRNLLVWRIGLKDWTSAGNVPELVKLISEPPPLPPPPQPRAERVWRSAAAIAISMIALWVASGYRADPLFAFPLLVGLDWATRKRREFAERLASRTTAAKPRNHSMP